ncbi:hypothetical protein BD414DRAFT_405122 [Trametes punicea]|nr:hypothetical protein BD414DRAFT_405122 [Trametes punicea]
MRWLRVAEIPKATRTSYDALLNDSMTRYFADGDNTPLREQREKLRIGTMLADNVYAHKAFCVDGGDAVISIGLAGRKRGPLGSIVTPILNGLESEELSKRKEGFIAKVSELLKAAFGDEISQMLEIRGLATAPEKQGRGYGTALMALADQMGDEQGRGVFAVTTDAHGFYQSIGYTLVQEGFVGQDDQRWKGPPVGIRVVKMPDEMGSRKAPLPLNPEETTLSPIVVMPLRYGDIPKAVRSAQTAIVNDPLTRYLHDADTVPGMRTRQTVALTFGYVDHVICRTGWTINHGEATVTLGLPGNRQGPLSPLIDPILKAFDSAELRKRKIELNIKVAARLKEAFGDSIEDMIEVRGLSTAPEKQGLGYGTALMHHANALADSQNRSVYLWTTEAYTFYETVGYSVVAEDVIGVDNPNWGGGPVHIRVVSRSDISRLLHPL